MSRTFRAVGLALVAILAMGAMIASSASAAGERFHSEKETTILTGSSEGAHVFSTTNGSFSVECSESHFKGTSVGTVAATVTVHPIYTNCTSSLGAAPVDTTGCNYVFGSETVENANKEKHLPVEIECTTGSTIKVTAPGCTLSFGTQKTSGGISIKNEGTGTSRDTTSVSTTVASFTKSGIGCFAVEGTDGTYKGATTMKGYEDKGVTGNIDESGGDGEAVYTEGAQIGTWWE